MAPQQNKRIYAPGSQESSISTSRNPSASWALKTQQDEGAGKGQQAQVRKGCKLGLHGEAATCPGLSALALTGTSGQIKGNVGYLGLGDPYPSESSRTQLRDFRPPAGVLVGEGLKPLLG